MTQLICEEYHSSTRVQKALAGSYGQALAATTIFQIILQQESIHAN